MATIPEMFQQGVVFGKLLEDSRRKNDAFNAAKEQYGDIAGDPGLFSALQNYDVVGANAQLAQDAAGRKQQQFSFDMQQQQQAKKRQAVNGVLQSLKQARDRGEDLGSAFDRVSRVLPQLGVDPGDIGAMKASLMENPDSLDDYLAAFGGAVPSVQKVASAASYGRKAASAAPSDSGPGGGNSDLVTADIVGRIDKLLDPARESSAQAATGAPGAKKLLGEGGFGQLGTLPSSAARDWAEDLSAVAEGDLRTQAIEILRGTGPITEKESEFVAAGFGNLSRGQSWPQLKRELEDLRAYMLALSGAAQRRAAGENVPEIVPGAGTGAGAVKEAAPVQQAPQAIYPGFKDKSGAVFKGGDPGDKNNWEMP